MSLMMLIALGFIIYPFFKYHGSKILLSVMCLVLPLVSILMYLHLGESDKLNRYWTLKNQETLVKKEMAKLKSPQQLIDRLTQHLRQNPASDRGWYLLGRLHFRLKDYNESEKALWKAYHAKPKNERYAVAYAQAVFLNRNQQLTHLAKRAIQNVLAINPKNTEAINLLAMDAYAKQHYQQAIEYWQSMLPLFAPGSHDNQTVSAMILTAQKKSVNLKSKVHNSSH